MQHKGKNMAIKFEDIKGMYLKLKLCHLDAVKAKTANAAR